MRITMLSLDAGPAGIRYPGSVVEVSAEEGRALIDGGYAVAAIGQAADAGATGAAGVLATEKFLARSVADIIEDLEALASEEACHRAIAAEESGRGRKGVLGALNDRLVELAPPGQA